MQLSSHKSESTIKEYAVKCPENKRKEMFDSLSTAMKPKVKKPKKNPPKATTQRQPLAKDINNTLPNFDLQQVDDMDTLDDDLLKELLSDFPEDQANSDKNVVATPTQNLQQTFSAQINAVTNQHNVPQMPQMLFSNSTVTINYNFGK